MGNAEDLESLRQENEKLKEENQQLREALARGEEQDRIFSQRLNHGIRTPLNAAIGLANLIIQKKIPEEDKEDCFRKIEQSGIDIIRILNDLWDYSYLANEEIHLEEHEYNVAEFLSDVDAQIRVRAGGKEIREHLDLDPDMPSRLYGDSTRLKQILMGVIDNAIRFTKEGSIFLRIYVDFVDDSDRVNLFFSVRDTGLGFSEEQVRHLFEPFGGKELADEDLSVEGSGFELPIVRRLVEVMNGGIQVSSEQGKGTEIFFVLPQRVVDKTPIDFSEDVIDDFHYVAPDAKVLIVDDNEINLTVACGHLAPTQIQTDTAISGEAAIEMVQKQSYDLIFMDYMMPGLNGLETVKKIRQLDGGKYKDIPMIALSANVVEQTKQIFKAEGMVDYLEKPIKPNDIIAAAKKWLPRELLVKTDTATFEVKTEKNLPSIEGINSEEGVKYSGSKKRWLEMLSDFYHIIDFKKKKIEEDMDAGNIESYTVEVHALKNTARLIGAMELSLEFYELEQLGDAKDIERINAKTPSVLSHFESYKPILKPYAFSQEEKKRDVVSKDEIIAALKEIRDAIDGFDLDGADAGMEKLNTYEVPEKYKERMKRLRALVADVAMEDVIKETTALIDELSK